MNLTIIFYFGLHFILLGALVSAGFEVSATVGGIMGTLGTIGTTCGTEADRSENATLIQRISADLLSSTGTRSQFTTFRKSLGYVFKLFKSCFYNCLILGTMTVTIL